MPRILRIINRFNLGGPTHNAAYLTRYLPSEFETLLVGGSQEATEEGSHHILDAVGVKPLVLPELQREVAPWRDRGAYRRIKQTETGFVLAIKDWRVHFQAQGRALRVERLKTGYRPSALFGGEGEAPELHKAFVAKWSDAL